MLCALLFICFFCGVVCLYRAWSTEKTTQEEDEMTMVL